MCIENSLAMGCQLHIANAARAFELLPQEAAGLRAGHSRISVRPLIKAT